MKLSPFSWCSKSLPERRIDGSSGQDTKATTRPLSGHTLQRAKAVALHDGTFNAIAFSPGGRMPIRCPSGLDQGSRRSPFPTTRRGWVRHATTGAPKPVILSLDQLPYLL